MKDRNKFSYGKKYGQEGDMRSVKSKSIFTSCAKLDLKFLQKVKITHGVRRWLKRYNLHNYIEH